MIIKTIKSFFKKITPDVDFCLGEFPNVPKISESSSKKTKTSKKSKKDYSNDSIDFNEYF